MLPNWIYDVNSNEKVILRYGGDLVARTKDGSADRSNVFTSFLTAEESDSGISQDSVVNEAVGLVGAGGGTTSVVLTYLVWAVLSSRRIQERIEAEVATLPTDVTDAQLEELPYLNAVIEETLRAHGAIPGPLSRVVPETGLDAAGYYIPPGTVVCTQAYSLHLKADIYSDPEL